MSENMAYVSVHQLDADPSANQSYDYTSTTTATAFSQAFDKVPGNVIVDDPTSRKDTKVSKFLSSLTGSQQSYDLVEDDDYEDAQITPRVEKKMAATSEEWPVEGDVPVRTASISRQLPLNHPKPDLQSLQGAYVKNVERLEESAERLSMTSSLEGELQRMKMEQRRKERAASASSNAESHRSRLRQFSATSLSNSIVDVNAAARSGCYSAAYVTSPVGSIRSPRANPLNGLDRQPSKSRLGNGLPQPELEGRPLDFGIDFSPLAGSMNLDPRPAAPRSISDSSNLERPGTSGSGDTFQQANTLFTDFDGVHYDGDRTISGPRRISLNRPPRARDSKAFREPQPGEEIVYYPAPVPVMLNLPMRLSKMNWGEREKKRLQALGEMPDDARKSASWLVNEDMTINKRQTMARLPPQLRASAFFDHRGIEQNIQLKDGSAVATLDSILDAAAHAPVSAFTDHPIAGQLGKEVYGAPEPDRKSMQMQPEKVQRRKSSMSNLLTRRSNGTLPIGMAQQSRVTSGGLRDGERDEQSGDEEDADDMMAPTPDEMLNSEENENASDLGGDLDDEYRPGFAVAPTTLLAELQMRKAQQKKRNRTAVDAFPNGMHSTLLELDTVTQLQQKARKQKHVTLAWEDHDAADKENYDDEDVPLGLLFPEKDRQEHINLNRPLGLMEKREMEENEPLSARRARLRGEPVIPVSIARSPAIVSQADGQDVPIIDLPSLDQAEDDNPDESLAQRMRKMKERKEKGISGDFVQEVSGELGLKVDDTAPFVSKTPDVEETLGQRRRRLKEEALRNGSRQASGESTTSGAKPALRSSNSLADLLRQNPVGFQDPNVSKTSLVAMQSYQQNLKRNPAYLADQQANAIPTAYPGIQMQPAIHSPTAGYQMYQNGISNYNYMGGIQNSVAGYGMPMHMAMGQMAYPYGIPAYGQQIGAYGMGPPLDPKQRATIDQWRQGIA